MHMTGMQGTTLHEKRCGPAVLCCGMVCAGAEAAAAYVSSSGIKLCALGADGQVLEQAGLKVR